ncbi:MAG: HEPN/Toprim-associated domain-containing protein [Candidatus Helarchaeota archaeon]
MGSTAYCLIDNLTVGLTNNDVDSNLISLFRSKDKKVTTLPENFPINLKYYRAIVEEDPDAKIVYYEASIDVIKDRLFILGYGIETAKDAFREWIKAEKKYKLEWAERNKGKNSEANKFLEDRLSQEYEILDKLTPEIWIDKLRIIHESGLKREYLIDFEEKYGDVFIGYMLSNDWYGFPGWDMCVPIRLAIEALDKSNNLIYDITELVWAEYFDYDVDLIQNEIDFSASEFASKFKTIILTEGKSDARILSKALNLLYPHLEDYYSFLDFDSTGFGGGVGNLANVVKAFAGSGIVNNVVALFDNDTAAISECMQFNNRLLPPNIVILHLPEIDLLRNYPTIGPSGSVNLDVNGMAASIELYLGEDVLKVDGKNLTPIQWTGFNKKIGQYQGEVLEKALIQERFEKKFKQAQKGEQLNWQDLDAVFQLIFSSISEKNRNIICRRASEYYSN